MNTLKPDFWKFVAENASADPVALRLKWHGKLIDGIDVDFAITQIECRRKFGKKLQDTLMLNPHFVFPSVLAGEQATSDALAAFHSSLYPNDMRTVDLTAGLGIDALHRAREAHDVTAIEYDELKAEALRLNASVNMQVICADCTDWISNQPADSYDLAFIDPARRSSDGGRVYALEDCQPDVAALLPKIMRIAPQLIIKLSPMLDITSIIRALPGVERVIALGTPTECKELVVMVLRDYNGEAEWQATTIGKDISTIKYTQPEEAVAVATYSNPKEGQFLYEPYPSVMKAAPFDLLSQEYNVDKLHPNTHLYTSRDFHNDFPGDKFVIERVIPYESKYIKRLSKDYPKISVATRNFDVATEVLRKKLGVKDGGDRRLLAATLNGDKKAMLILSPYC